MLEQTPENIPQNTETESPLPTLPDGQVDLNKLAEEYRTGAREHKNIPIGDLLDTPGGFHNSHMVNPELHPPLEGEVRPDLGAVQAAFRASEGRTAEEMIKASSQDDTSEK